MSEEQKKEETKTEMTPWRVERLGNGELRCARNEVGNEKNAEYNMVPVPVFSPGEMAAIANLCLAMGGDVRAYDVSDLCFNARYNRNARILLERLSGAAQ